MSPEITGAARSWIQKTPGVCGGDACVRDTRVPVWSVVNALHLGASHADLLTYFVIPLTPADVQAALDYYDENDEEINTDIRLNEEA